MTFMCWTECCKVRKKNIESIARKECSLSVCRLLANDLILINLDSHKRQLVWRMVVKKKKREKAVLCQKKKEEKRRERDP